MMWFLSYGPKGFKRIVEFHTPEKLFAWLQEHNSENGDWPTNLCVFKAECVFDGS